MRSTSKRFDLWGRSIKGIEEGKPYQERKKNDAGGGGVMALQVCSSNK